MSLKVVKWRKTNNFGILPAINYVSNFRISLIFSLLNSLISSILNFVCCSLSLRCQYSFFDRVLDVSQFLSKRKEELFVALFIDLLLNFFLDFGWEGFKNLINRGRVISLDRNDADCYAKTKKEWGFGDLHLKDVLFTLILYSY